MMISTRSKKLIEKPSMIVEAGTICASDPFSHENSSGFLNFGVAENYLMEKELLQKLNSYHLSSTNLIHYDCTYGTITLRQSYIEFLELFFQLKEANVENVIVAGGATSILEMIAYCLCNENDKIVIPTPYYLGFDHDFTARFGVKILAYNLVLDDHFFNYLKSTQPKAVVITRPDNPNGKVHSFEFIEKLSHFCRKNKIHLIIDEVYALTNLSDDEFVSALTLIKDNEYLHHVYSMAKDFCLSGFKVGFFYSKNIELLKAMRAVSYFYTPSNQTQDTCAQLLADHAWIKGYINENKERLLNTLSLFERELGDIFSYQKPQAAFFLYMNFTKLMKIHHLSTDEELFHFFIHELKINILPGKFFHDSTSGNFRICFARELPEVKEFINRIKSVL